MVRGRESHRTPQLGNKQGHKAVGKNARAKEMMSKRRQKQWKVVEKPVIIDVEKYQAPQKAKVKKSGSGSLIFLKEIERSCWVLQDYWWTISSMLLRRYLSRPSQLSGLQSVTCGLTMNLDIEPAEFVQILHNGQGHWLTISTTDTSHPDVHVYDSQGLINYSIATSPNYSERR